MKIGLLADTHDNVDNVLTAVEALTGEGVRTLLHCGDVCGPAVVEALEGFNVTFARGNMDRQLGLGLAIAALQGPGRLARLHALTLDSVRVALLHGDDVDLLERTINSGDYAYVFHGHTHRQDDRLAGTTRVINPGALGGTRRGPRSFCILDLASGAARYVVASETSAPARGEGSE